MGELQGKVALVTGTSRPGGIGYTIALRLAEEGATVVVTGPPQELRDRSIDPPGWRGIESLAEKIRGNGGNAATIPADLTKQRDVEALMKATIHRFKHIYVVVNNAAATPGEDRAPVVDLAPEEWNRCFAVGAFAPFLICKWAARNMIEHGQGGRIINIGASAAKHGYALRAAYSASKFALIGLTQSLALEVARHGITVNAVCPGMTDTPRLDMASKVESRHTGASMEEEKKMLIEGTARVHPAGHIGTSDDVAHMVAFLASARAAWVTGQMIFVNGGQLLH